MKYQMLVRHRTIDYYNNFFVLFSIQKMVEYYTDRQKVSLERFLLSILFYSIFLF
jgi:hypothetical protein